MKLVVDKAMVGLVYEVTQQICKKHGYLTGPSRSNVDIVLQAVFLIHDAVQKLDEEKEHGAK